MTKNKQNRHSGLIEQVSINVKKLRVANNLSQEELADLSGYHRTYIGAIERGERNITLTTLEKIAKTLKVSPEFLLKEKGFHDQN